MSLKEQLRRDLAVKLHDDVARSLMHFHEMCEIAEIRMPEQWSTILSALARLMIDAGHAIDMPKDAFFDILSKQWDRSPKRTRSKR